MVSFTVQKLNLTHSWGCIRFWMSGHIIDSHKRRARSMKCQLWNNAPFIFSNERLAWHWTGYLSAKVFFSWWVGSLTSPHYTSGDYLRKFRTKGVFLSNLGGPSSFLDISETRTGVGHLDQESTVSWKAYCQVLPLLVTICLQNATLLVVLFLPSPFFISKEFQSMSAFIDYVIKICVGKSYLQIPRQDGPSQDGVPWTLLPFHFVWIVKNWP